MRKKGRERLVALAKILGRSRSVWSRSDVTWNSSALLIIKRPTHDVHHVHRGFYPRTIYRTEPRKLSLQHFLTVQIKPSLSLRQGPTGNERHINSRC